MPLSVNCPGCREPLDVDDAYRTWKVRCPRCRHEFFPQEAAEEGEYDPTPRRRPRRRRLSDDEIVERAKALVAGPASWLRLFGGLGVFFGLLGVLGAIGGGIWLSENPPKPPPNAAGPDREEVLVQIVFVGVIAAFCIVLGGFIMFGAMKMGRLDSHGWAMAASILAIASMLCCNCSLMSGVPLGIWGLVALSNAKVRDGFDIVAHRRLDANFAHDAPAE